MTALTPVYSGNKPAATASDYINYLRGDQFNEVGSVLKRSGKTSTQSLRTRTLLLGDIIDSKITSVAAPGMSYTDSANPGYAAFKTLWTNRPAMIYVGANDGMLHAFRGDNGHEQFAYVPSVLIQGPSTPATPQIDGLAQIGNPSYAHHYYVDATPYSVDVDFNNTVGHTTTSPDWRTLLIGGLGKGGKTYYAIDVTDPANMNNEAAMAKKVLWEFTAPTMGFSFGTPTVVKTLKYGWVVALTSGYDNSDSYGYLYLVNPRTGALLETIKTSGTSMGLTQASAYVQDYTDYTADSIYVGDLNGQLWRFDLTGTPNLYPAPALLAKLRDSSGTAQPITSAPLIEIYPTTRKRFVMLGTGQLLSSYDVASSAAQSFYAIIDGTAVTNGFNSVVAGSPLYPQSDTGFTQVTDVTAGFSTSATSKGWYINFGITSNIGWRMVLNPVAYNGVVAFTALLTTGNPCSPSGTNRVYAVNYSNAMSVLTNNTTGYFNSTIGITDLKIINAPGSGGPTGSGTSGTPQILAGTSAGGFAPIAANMTSTTATRLLNWREVPTAE